MAGKVKTLLNIQREKLQELDLCNLEAVSTWTYISFKAARFLVVGAELYRKQDHFHYPLTGWNTEKLINGCEQIIYNCAGLPSFKTCFINLTEQEIINLFELFHFSKIEGTQHKIRNIAKMQFCHKIDSRFYSTWYK